MSSNAAVQNCVTVTLTNTWCERHLIPSPLIRIMACIDQGDSCRERPYLVANECQETAELGEEATSEEQLCYNGTVQKCVTVTLTNTWYEGHLTPSPLPPVQRKDIPTPTHCMGK
ncbi:hypothetical protein CEXT_46011 [Caerostris extrusa]|uniref:Uncharacterized protein n=1 Tax=Caerostris extrusa TaxID=172846 RepID=A0AAV4XAD7_CAEEX|nr:hypothetical protein CEXT_46011 [Caerostris extrusa]